MLGLWDCVLGRVWLGSRPERSGSILRFVNIGTSRPNKRIFAQYPGRTRSAKNTERVHLDATPSLPVSRPACVALPPSGDEPKLQLPQTMTKAMGGGVIPMLRFGQQHGELGVAGSVLSGGVVKRVAPAPI
jgi:hypothetical protein